MPHEQEMPAPVTTTMRLLLATESERLASVRRATGSDAAAARSNVVTMRRDFMRGGEEGGRVQRVDERDQSEGVNENVTLSPKSSSLKSVRVRHVM